MGALYRVLLEKMQRRRFPVFGPRIRLTGWDKALAFIRII
jgi:hypothetical protein